MNRKFKFHIINYSLNVLLILVSFIFILSTIEFVYRYQIIDFYQSEYKYLNKNEVNNNKSKKILVFGDSFTAATNSYVLSLKDSLKNLNFINAGIPGIGVQEINCIAERRIQETKPSMVILQFYVGNDLIDIKKPINWKTLSFARNLFWFLANHFYSIRYLNYKLGQIKQTIGQSLETEFLKNNDSFSVDKMSKREKLLIQADPNYYEKSIFVTTEYEDRFQVCLSNTIDIYELCKQNNIPLKILVIPASCQVSNEYKQNLEQCGAQFNNMDITKTTYPFITRLESHFQKENIEILNPLGVFQQKELGCTNLYYKNDLHLNNNGNIVLAEFITNNLKETVIKK